VDILRQAAQGNENMNATTETENRPAPRQAERQEWDRGFVAPPANICASENEYLLEVDMPGVDKEGLEVTIEGNELTIIGRRKSELPGGELLHRESPLADYRRVFELGPDIDTSKINAEMQQGVLRLHLPKSEKAKPKQIEVKVV